MNRKGQAAVTDALFFLLVVISLSVFLFGFANSYGSSIKQQVSEESSTTFATNSLKTILYSSTPRDPSQSIYDSDAEIDYLLAILKEDYADDQIIGDREKLVLGKTISSILSPISDSTDYIFYITIPDKRKFVYFYFHTTNFTKKDAGIPGRFFIYSTPEGGPSHIDYFCALGSADYTTVMAKLSRMLANVGATSQASSSIKLIKEFPDGTPGDFKSQVDLILWDAAWLGTTEQRTSGLLYKDNPAVPDAEWGCKKVGEVESSFESSG